MKKNLSILLAILTLSFFLLTCRKKEEKFPPCDIHTELKDQEHLADINVVKDAPELLDTLAKYPELQVYRVFNDEYSYGMHCHIFHKGLLVFSDNYQLWKSKRDGSLFQFETMIDSVNISLTPVLGAEDAINISQQHQDYRKTCIGYRLGIYDINSGTSYQPKNYKLVWKVQGDKGIPYVVLDANSGEVYIQDDGIRY